MSFFYKYRLLESVKDLKSYILISLTDKKERLFFQNGFIDTIDDEQFSICKNSYRFVKDYIACIGCIEIELDNNLTASYLFFITKCRHVGVIEETKIFQIINIEIISLNPEIKRPDKISNLYNLLISGIFYFSWNKNDNPFDLTISLQRQKNFTETDNQYFWNKLFYLSFIYHGIDTNKWLTKIMAGSVVINTTYIGKNNFTICLLSRLSMERFGTRFNVRGIDDNGNVANFVETEQCVFINGKVKKCSSYVILRGSVPLFWYQSGLNLGSHRIKFSRSVEATEIPYSIHLQNLFKLYNQVTIINLLKNKDDEKILSETYNKLHKEVNYLKNIPFINFDYHENCSNGRESNLLDILKNDIKDQLNNFNIFLSTDFEKVNINPVIEHLQKGVFRINCVDCLDRTNSVQTFIGLLILSKQVDYLKLYNSDQIYDRLKESFKIMWSVNGDNLSNIYAGTPALDGKNKLLDGTLSIARSIQSNFLDSFKQEAFDMLISPCYFSSNFYEKLKCYLPYNFLFLRKNFLQVLLKHYLSYTKVKKLNLTIGTWNVGGSKCFDVDNLSTEVLSDWLLNLKDDNNEINLKSDIFAIGMQEVIDLNTSNIVLEKSSNNEKFVNLLEKTISQNTPYSLVSSTQLVGISLNIFVKQSKLSKIRDIHIDQIKTGLGGQTGNKGGVAIRFTYYNTSLCFICAHFSAGQLNVSQRNQDYNEICSRISFGSSRKLEDHDYIFWCGDLNYRIDMNNKEVRDLINNNKLKILLENDQLIKSINEKKVFSKYLEGEIKFPPTYKFNYLSNNYDTSEKERIPAWTDRILFKKNIKTSHDDVFSSLNYGKFNYYNKADILISDHKPVVANIDFDILKVNKKKFSKILRDIIKKYQQVGTNLKIEHQNGILVFSESYIKNLVLILNTYVGKIKFFILKNNYLLVSFEITSNANIALNNFYIKQFDPNLILSLFYFDFYSVINKSFDLFECNTIPLYLEDTLNTKQDKYSLINYSDKLLSFSTKFEDYHLILNEIENGISMKSVSKFYDNQLELISDKLSLTCLSDLGIKNNESEFDFLNFPAPSLPDNLFDDTYELPSSLRTVPSAPPISPVISDFKTS